MASANQCRVVKHIEPLTYTDGHKTRRTLKTYFIVLGEWLSMQEVVERYGFFAVEDAKEVFHDPALIIINSKEESWKDCLQSS